MTRMAHSEPQPQTPAVPDCRPHDAVPPAARPSDSDYARLAMSEPEVFFIVGSLNQTTQLHAVEQELRKRIPGLKSWFSPFYGDELYKLGKRLRLIEMTIGGYKRSRWALDYLEEQGLRVDQYGRRASRGHYDLVVTSSDLVMPRNIRDKRTVLVQEGMIDPENLAYDLLRRWPWHWHAPRWAPGTAMTGLSGLYDRMCVASEGYRDHLIERGVPPEHLAVTGIPNFDHCEQYYENDIEEHGYLLACTSDARELGAHDDRRAFLAGLREKAAGRPIIVKLHPNEHRERATREVAEVLPEAKVVQGGSAEQMIANCDVLVTQWSTVIYVGLALGKECYSYRDMGELRRLMPLQNSGTSACRIADVCVDLLARPVEEVVPKSRSHVRFKTNKPIF